MFKRSLIKLIKLKLKFIIIRTKKRQEKIFLVTIILVAIVKN